MRFVAVVLLILGLVSVNNGLRLVGSPLSAQNQTRAIFAPQASGQDSPASQKSVIPSNKLDLTASNKGYSPQRLYAKAGEPILINIATQNTTSCARDFVIPAIGLEVLLPESGNMPVSVTAQAKGTIMHFSCSMGMYTGEIVFSE
jgi:uncharacterized protein